MNFQEKLKNLIDNAKRVTLLKEEKQLMRHNLVKMMQDFPVKERHEGRANFASFLFSDALLRRATVSLAAFLVVCFLGAGISTAAEGSLPGEFLYPVKTEVNERVLGWFASSDEKKAELYIKLTNKRLEEIEQVAHQGKLDEKVKVKIENSIDNNIAKAKGHIKKTENKNESALDLNANLEGSLQAHSAIIEQIAVYKDEEKGRLSNFSKKVNQHLEEVKEERKNVEEKALEKNDKVKEESQRKIKNVKNKLEATKKEINNKKSKTSEDDYRQVEKEIESLDKVISDSEEKVKGEKYEDAFRSLQGASKSLSEINTGFKARTKLKMGWDRLKVDIGNNVSAGSDD